MANYIATDTDLTAVADAIRTKGGTSAELVFPTGFVSAIGDISGGGLTLVASKEFTANVTSSSDVDIGTIDCGPSIYGSDKIVIVRIRDKAGSRNTYYYGSLIMCIAYTQGGSEKTYLGTMIFVQNNLGTINVAGNASAYGIRVAGISDQGVITLVAKHSAAAGKIDGTFLVEVFVVGEPGGVDMLAGNPIT